VELVTDEVIKIGGNPRNKPLLRSWPPDAEFVHAAFNTSIIGSRSISSRKAPEGILVASELTIRRYVKKPREKIKAHGAFVCIEWQDGVRYTLPILPN